MIASTCVMTPSYAKLGYVNHAVLVASTRVHMHASIYSTTCKINEGAIKQD